MRSIFFFLKRVNRRLTRLIEHAPAQCPSIAARMGNLVFALAVGAGGLASLRLATVATSTRSSDMVSLGWWFVICALGTTAVRASSYPTASMAGFLAIGLGLFVALDANGAAQTLAGRRPPSGSPLLWPSARRWRLWGVLLVLIGCGWSIALRLLV